MAELAGLLAGDVSIANSFRVLALRLYYLTVYIGLGAVLPLLALAMQERGFRASEYAWLVAMLPLSRLLAPPLWGAVADKWLGTARLLRVNTLIAAVTMALLSQRLPLLQTVIVFAVWAFVSSSLVPLAEAGTYALLGEKSAKFAYIRVFGSIGFAVSATAVGLIGVDRSLSAPFWAGAIGYVLSSLCAFRLPTAQNITRVSLKKTVGAIAKRSDVILLWVGSTFYYLAHGAYDVYYGPHIRTIAGVDDSMVSLCWAVGVTAEIVLVLFVPRLLNARLSVHLLALSAMVAVLRWILLAYASSTAMIWMLQPLHAVTFGLWYLVFAHENQRGVPDAVRATVQGFVAACLGLGMICATVLGGYVMEAFGGRVLFTCASLSAALSCGFYIARFRMLSRSSARALAEAKALAA